MTKKPKQIDDVELTSMTLRDYFAAKAMQSIFSYDETISYLQDAEEAYRMADAMIKERNREQ